MHLCSLTTSTWEADDCRSGIEIRINTFAECEASAKGRRIRVVEPYMHVRKFSQNLVFSSEGVVYQPAVPLGEWVDARMAPEDAARAFSLTERTKPHWEDSVKNS